MVDVPKAGGLLSRLSGALGERVDRFALFRMTRELRAIREVLEVLADLQLRQAGQPPKYSILPGAEPTDIEAPNASAFIGNGDYLTVYAIEELAREANIRLTGDEDLEKLARDRGWVSAEGQFLVLPSSLGGGPPV